MATFVQTDINLWIDEFDLSADHNSVGLAYGAETPENTVYGDDTRSVSAGGLFTVRLEGEGYWQVAVDATLFARVGIADTVASVAPVDGSEGSPAFFMKLVSGEYGPMAGTVGDMAAFRVSGEGRGGAGLIRGEIFLNKASVSSSGDSGTGIQLGDVSATQSVYASLHAIAVSGGTLDVTVDSDDSSGMGTATTQITFAQVTAVGSEFASAAGVIADDYWQVVFTIAGGGTFDFVVCVGIK